MRGDGVDGARAGVVTRARSVQTSQSLLEMTFPHLFSRIGYAVYRERDQGRHQRRMHRCQTPASSASTLQIAVQAAKRSRAGAFSTSIQGCGTMWRIHCLRVLLS